MTELLQDLWNRISSERLRDLTLEMVRIPSPTGNSVAVTRYYAEQLGSTGLPVEVVLDYPQSPSTIARLGNHVTGRTLTLDGHLDTIHATHVAPRLEAGRIFGRGAGDMKSGVAVMVEAARILVEAQMPLAGNLVFATHSLHEAPVGNMEGLKALIARGDVFGDAALVLEGGFDQLAIRGKGQALYELDIWRDGEVLHENAARPRGIANPLHYATALCHRLLERHAELAEHDEPLLGPETMFIGQIHGGDFYNRVPTRAFLNGTYRYWPDKSWNDVEAEFQQLLASVAWPDDIHADLRLLSNGLGYAIKPDAAIANSLRRAYKQVVGNDLPDTGAQSVSDVNIIAREAGIPVVAHGTGSTTAHADLESVAIKDIARTTRVVLATIVDYLGIQE